MVAAVRLAVATLVLLLGVGRAEAGTARATLTVTATVVRSIAVKAEAVRTEREGVVGARATGVRTSVRTAPDVPWVETRAERRSEDGTKEVVVTVWADGEPPAVVLAQN